MSVLDAHTDLDEATLIARLRSGDEALVKELIDEWSPAMLRLAGTYVSSQQAADQVVQQTWRAVIRGLATLEGRSSVRSWTFSLLIDNATTGLSASAALTGKDADAPTVDPTRFLGPDEEHPGAWTSSGGPDEEHPGAWTSSGAPRPWHQRHQIVDVVDLALDLLPEPQRTVVLLRDVQGLSADETCSTLRLSTEHQQALLHLGRAALRAVLEEYAS